MEYIAEIVVTLKDGIRDSQGIAIDTVLKRTGFEGNSRMAVGKYFMFSVNSENEKIAFNKVNKICQEVLTNPVLENFEIRSIKRK